MMIMAFYPMNEHIEIKVPPTISGISIKNCNASERTEGIVRTEIKNIETRFIMAQHIK